MFSGTERKINKAEAVFWPGCSLMQLDPSVLFKCHEILKREEPEIGLAALCCAQPSYFLFREKFDAREADLAHLFQVNGTRRVYTACPNCNLQLKDHTNLEVISIWPVLASHLRVEDISEKGGSVALHDPCPFRNEQQQHEAVRKLLELAEVEILPCEREKAKTRCCGNFQMMTVKAPEKSVKMRENRLTDFPPDAEIASYCEGCLRAFRSEKRNTVHILELLFGRSASRSLWNLWSYSRKIQKQ